MKEKVKPDNLHMEHANKNMASDFPIKIFKRSKRINEGMHAHDYFQIWYVAKGECTHCFNGELHNLKRGSIFVLPPGVSHALLSDGIAELICLEFTEEFIEQQSDTNEKILNYSYIRNFFVPIGEIKPNFQLKGEESKKIESLLEEALYEFEEKNEYYKLFIKANVLKILAIISRAYSKNINIHKELVLNRYHSSIERTIEYINENYQNQLFLKDVCKIAIMSKANFSNVFKEMTGSTFTGYVNELRIKKAKEYLLTSNMTMLEISMKIGFSDIAYFNRVFKKIVGVSPTQYRKNAVK